MMAFMEGYDKMVKEGRRTAAEFYCDTMELLEALKKLVEVGL